MILAWARLRSSWVWLLILFTFSSFIETIFFGQLGAFTPLYLPRIGVRPEEVTLWTGIIASVSGILGLPFLPFWGALADRYARKPVIVRSFVVHLLHQPGLCGCWECMDLPAGAHYLQPGAGQQRPDADHPG